VRNAGTWSEQKELTASDSVPVEFFGFSVALSGDGNTVVVGTPFVPSTSSSGAAYVFGRQVFSTGGTSWGQQGQQAKLTAASSANVGQFGVSLAVSGDGSTVVVGANSTNNRAGAAFVFLRNEMA